MMFSVVAIGGQGGQSTGAPQCRHPMSQAVNFKNNYPVTKNADIVLKRAQKFTCNYNSQLFMLYGRLVHVGETFNRFADFGLWSAQKNAFDGRVLSRPAGGAIALPYTL